MQCPIKESLTPEQIAKNVAACEYLIKGKYYRFNPPVIAGAIPTGGPNVCKVQECEFDRGWYMGFIDGDHVFQGKPINDRRLIALPHGYDTYDTDIIDQLRDSYFRVLFIGGSPAVLDENQKH